MAAMIAMGAIAGGPERVETGPECPAIFRATFQKYRDLKFIQRDNEGTLVIYPRDILKWQDIAAYKESTRDTITALEAELIMGLDAIFEGREDV